MAIRFDLSENWYPDVVFWFADYESGVEMSKFKMAAELAHTFFLKIGLKIGKPQIKHFILS